MTAQRLEGRPVAESIWARVADGAAALLAARGRPPHLALVRGTDEAAHAYARQIERAFARYGLATSLHDAGGGRAETCALVERLGADPAVDGVLVLSPLPGNVSVADVALHLPPRKDVDGQHPENLGRLAQRRPWHVPATALGGLRLLQHFAVPLRGRRAVVVGRSPVVGLPLALLLLGEDATVAVAHSRTADLAEVTRQADILCVAAGQAGLIGREHVRAGQVVLDFGTNPADDGGLVGDVRFDEVLEVVDALTPVPGGLGPVTVAVIAEQTLAARQPA